MASFYSARHFRPHSDHATVDASLATPFYSDDSAQSPHLLPKAVNFSDFPPDLFTLNMVESPESMARKMPWIISSIQDLQTKVESLEKRLDHTQDIQAIQHLLNHYTALHDDAVSDLGKRKEWENLFAIDGVAVYPFGSHQGRAGKGDWAFGSVSYFERCQLLSSNFDISYSPPKEDARPRAQVRTNCIAQWVKKKDVLDDHFDEGGFYYWTLRKEEDGKWYIEHVHLTITWTMGEDPTGVGPMEGKQGTERAGKREDPYAVDRA